MAIDITPVQEHEDTFKRLYQESLQEFNTVLSALTVKPYKRLKAVLLHNIVVEMAIAHFEHIDNVNVIPKYESAQFEFSNGMVARFKKINKERLSSGFPTPRSLAIIGQQGSLFPEFNDPVFIEIAYFPNAAWSQFEMLIAIKRKDKDIFLLFEMDLDGLAEVTIKSNPVSPDMPADDSQIKMINE